MRGVGDRTVVLRGCSAFSGKVTEDDDEHKEEEVDMSGYNGREVVQQLEPVSCATSLCLPARAFAPLDSYAEA